MAMRFTVENTITFYSPMCRIEKHKKKKKLVVKKLNDRLSEKQKCSIKLATHSLLSVIIIKKITQSNRKSTDKSITRKNRERTTIKV